MKHLLYIFSICFIATFSLFAQSFDVTPKSIQVGEGGQFQVSYTLEGANMDDFQAPDLSDFFVVSGPNRQQSMQIVNGRMSQSSSIIYVLTPKKQGVYSIPSATVVSNGKSMRSGKVKVVVSKGAGNNSNRQGQRQGQMQTAPPTVDAADLESLIFLRIITDTLSAYQGQQVNAYYRLYTAVDVTDYTIIGTPQLTGFWVQDLTPQRLEAGNIELIDSVSYRTYDLKEYALFPQRSGTLTITPMEVEIVAQIPVGNHRSFFRSHRREKITVQSDTLDINIYPFPEEDKPESFAGAVGNYQMSAKFDRSAIREGETAQVNIIINGEGNVKLLEAPKLTVPAGLETFEPEIEESTYNQQGKVKGRKIFTFDILANEQGRYDLGPIEFSFFDPEAEQYKIVSSPKYKLVVMKGDGTPLPEETANDTDLRPIKMETTLHKKGGKVFASIWFWVLFLLPFLIFPFFLQWHRKREAILSDTVSLKRKLALQVASKRLTTADLFMKQNNKKAFYNEVVKTIWDYLSDKLNLQTTDLSKDNIRVLLEEKNVSTAKIDQLIDTIRYCEMALFAPVADADNLQKTYTDTQELIADLEDFLGGEK